MPSGIYKRKANLPRQEARQQRQATFEGKACKNCQSTIRLTKTGTCIACRKEAYTTYSQRADIVEKRKKIYKENTQIVIGSACKTCGSMERYKSGHCIRCKRQQQAKLRQRPEAKRKKQIYKRKFRYNLSEQDVRRLLFLQKGLCAICSVKLTKFAVDHDHKCCPFEVTCGKCVRGLLCNECNTALGMMNDDTSRLRSAITYLETITYQPTCLQSSASQLP
jgi:uncharacterized OB-fold protein